jgi:hypothetical protein
LARVTVAPRIQSMVRPLRCDDVPQPPWVACPPTPTLEEREMSADEYQQGSA